MAKSCQNVLFVMTIVVIIMVMATISLGNVYNSPRTCKMNSQVTQMEIVGTKWFAESKHVDTELVANVGSLSFQRFDDFNFGMELSRINKPVRMVISERTPSHFGYDGNNSVIEALNFQDVYMITFELDRVGQLAFPENVRQKCHQYTEEDFARLNADPFVAQVYSNGELDVWRVFSADVPLT